MYIWIDIGLWACRLLGNIKKYKARHQFIFLNFISVHQLHHKHFKFCIIEGKSFVSRFTEWKWSSLTLPQCYKIINALSMANMILSKSCPFFLKWDTEITKNFVDHFTCLRIIHVFDYRRGRANLHFQISVLLVVVVALILCGRLGVLNCLLYWEALGVR